MRSAHPDHLLAAHQTGGGSTPSLRCAASLAESHELLGSKRSFGTPFPAPHRTTIAPASAKRTSRQTRRAQDTSHYATTPHCYALLKTSTSIHTAATLLRMLEQSPNSPQANYACGSRKPILYAIRITLLSEGASATHILDDTERRAVKALLKSPSAPVGKVKSQPSDTGKTLDRTAYFRSTKHIEARH
jgi:hypothetical protein